MTKRAGTPQKQSFLHGALILLVATAIVKLVGALFKIPLNTIITEVGMGYFNCAYTFYTPIFSLATAGFPIAISRLVSEYYTRNRFRDVRQIHRISIAIFLVLGTVAFAVMVFGARPYVEFANSADTDALPAVYALAPAAFFSSMVAIYRGYYQGLRNMYPTAFSEVVEALSKLIFGLTGAYVVIKIGLSQYEASGWVFNRVVKAPEGKGLEYATSAALPFAAAAAIAGVSIGSLLSFLILFFYHRSHSDGITDKMLRSSPRSNSTKYLTGRMLRTAIPVALGSLTVNLNGLVDATFLQKSINDIMASHSKTLLDLYNGLIRMVDIEQNRVATALYGNYTNAMTLYLLIPTLTQVFGTSALPNVTAAWTRGNPKEIKKSIETVLRTVTLIALPAGIGLSVLAEPIAAFLNFSPITARVLTVLALSAAGAALYMPINSILQSVGRVDLPVKFLLGGLVIKLTLNITLSGIPTVNIMGAAVATLCCDLFILFMSLVALRRHTKIKLNLFPIFLKPGLAAGLCAVSAYLVQRVLTAAQMPGRFATLAALFVAVVVYGIGILWFHALRKSDILMLPKGQKIAKILEKHHWIR